MSVALEETPAVAPVPTVPDDHVIVLFGATGDLARRKLLPGNGQVSADSWQRFAAS